MSQGVSGEISPPPAGMAPPPARRGGIPTWLIIVIVLVVLCGLALVVLLCVLPTAGLTLLGPQLGNVFGAAIAAVGCQVENPDLSDQACSNWATALPQSYPDEMEACQSLISGNDNDPDVASAYYDCLIDQGVPPPQ